MTAECTVAKLQNSFGAPVPKSGLDALIIKRQAQTACNLLLGRQLRIFCQEPVQFPGDHSGLFLLGHVPALRNDRES